MLCKIDGVSKSHVNSITWVPCSIKARFKGGDTWYAGKISALNRDGSYAVHYADGDMESNVHRDLIEVIFLRESFQRLAFLGFQIF
jgi:hypothetical protein